MYNIRYIHYIAIRLKYAVNRHYIRRKYRFDELQFPYFCNPIIHSYLYINN